HGPQGVLDLARNLHQAHGASPIAAIVPAAMRGLRAAAVRLRPLEALAAGIAPRIRSTYLTSISLSTLMESPGRLKPSVVSLSVCGISATEKRRPRMPKSVRLMPSMATEP